MAARVISFPKLAAVNEEESAVRPSAATPQPSPAGRLHLVKPVALVHSQQTALRIVEAVCVEHNLQHPRVESESAHTPEFWATLPVPPARVETPFTVARRLMHVVLPIIELA